MFVLQKKKNERKLGMQGPKLSFYSGDPNCIVKSYLKVLCTSLGSLQKFEGAEGVFKRALGSRLQLILSPSRVLARI